MKLSSMRYKNYVWPHNPRTYAVDYRRTAAVHKVPFGKYVLQDMGLCNRVLRGEGEFAGPGAYEQFARLAAVFYDDGPGILSHPLWQSSNALFVELSLLQEPTEDYVRYAFEFWECFDGYEGDPVSEMLAGYEAELRETGRVETLYHELLAGESLWTVAINNGLSIEALVELNPQVKNPNLAAAGDVLRVG